VPLTLGQAIFKLLLKYEYARFALCKRTTVCLFYTQAYQKQRSLKSAYCSPRVQSTDPCVRQGARCQVRAGLDSAGLSYVSARLPLRRLTGGRGEEVVRRFSGQSDGVAAKSPVCLSSEAHMSYRSCPKSLIPPWEILLFFIPALSRRHA
jgi:hypothetical protein